MESGHLIWVERLHVERHPLAEICGKFVAPHFECANKSCTAPSADDHKPVTVIRRACSIARFDFLVAIAALELLVGAHQRTFAAALYVCNGWKADISRAAPKRRQSRPPRPNLATALRSIRSSWSLNKKGGAPRKAQTRRPDQSALVDQNSKPTPALAPTWVLLS